MADSSHTLRATASRAVKSPVVRWSYAAGCSVFFALSLWRTITDVEGKSDWRAWSIFAVIAATGLLILWIKRRDLRRAAAKLPPEPSAMAVPPR